MATIAAKVTGGKPLGSPPRGTLVIAWDGLTGATSDVGDAQEFPQFPDKSVQVEGTFGTSTVRIEGTNDTDVNGTPQNWRDLNDPQANALTFTAARIEQILENPRFIRPAIPAGGSATGIKVSMLCSRTKVPRQ